MTKVLRRSLSLLVLTAALLGQSPPDGAAPDSTPAQAPASGAAPAAPQANGAAPAQPPPRTGALPIASGAVVAVVPIDGLIYDFTLDSLQRRVDRAIAGGATVIVIELNTPGGIVTSALKICRYIKKQKVPTIAWVNDEAYSAGILIASSCSQIVMSPASATGDCAPIVPGQSLAPTERAKALSPILAEFNDNARTNGYDYALFHAMCVLGVKLYLIQNPATGERRLVNQVDYDIMVKGGDGKSVMQSIRGMVGWEDAEAISRDVATDADVGKWQAVKKVGSFNFPDGLVHDGKTLFTTTQARAVAIGLAQSDTIGSLADVKQYLNAASVTRLKQNWSEELANWLTHPYVRAALIVALLLGAYFEFQTPGVGVAGAVALVALIALLGAPFLIGLAEVWHVILFFIGFLMLMAELFVTPGFGVLGISGLIFMFAGLVLAVVPTGSSGPLNLPPPEMLGYLRTSVMWTLIGVILSFVGFYYLAKHFGSIPILNRLILASPEAAAAAAMNEGEPPTKAPTAPRRVSGDEAVGQGDLRVGDKGMVVVQLRPAGRARFDGRVIDVVSVGSWLEPGQGVRVVEVRGNRIVVDADGQA